MSDSTRGARRLVCPPLSRPHAFTAVPGRRVSRAALAFCAAGFALLGGASAYAATVTVDLARKQQTIEGFGFFGAHDVWWSSSEQMVDPAWVEMIVHDLGLSMWRNEYYPPGDENGGQDADWDKQRPVVQALRDRAALSGVPLKVVLTVWSPPAGMKCVYDDGIRDGEPHPDGTKGGGALCPSRRDDFADWLIEGLGLYADVGVDVYALSFQNEPYFWEPYNSCFYPQDYYAETLAAIGPRIHAAFPRVKLFGSENMLEIECGANDVEFDPWWYTATIMDNEAALAELGAFAAHGYSDGVLATAGSKMSRLWANFHEGVQETGKPIWMTETSGYVDSWEPGNNGDGEERPGALDLAQAIYAALYHGKASAWIWWQGSELGQVNEFALMNGTSVGKRYYASKQFYRFIRPGARMVETTSDDSSVLAAAFERQALGSFIVVLINGDESSKSVALEGDGLPEQFEVYRTSASEDCLSLPSVSRDSITLPARSLTTLVSGPIDDDASNGAGGSAHTGGSAGSAGEAAEPATSGGHAGAAASSGGSGSGGEQQGASGVINAEAGAAAAQGGHADSPGAGGSAPAAGGSSGGSSASTAGTSQSTGGGPAGSGARASGGAAVSSGGVLGTAASTAAGGSGETGGLPLGESGAAPSEPSKDDEGCSCRATGSDDSKSRAGFAALVLLLAGYRRRCSGERRAAAARWS